MDSKKYNLKLDSEDEVSRLLTALPRVDAPSNFNFEVKARIASRKQSGSWVERIPFVLRFAFPALLIMLVGAYVYLYQFPGRVDTNEQRAGVATVPSTAAEPKNEASSAPTGTPGELVAQDDSASAAANNRSGAQDHVDNPAGKQNSKTAKGGSRDFAQDNIRSITKPGAQDPSKAQGVGPVGSQLSVKQVLSPMGIDTVYENGGWKVMVVTADSPAMRSGIIKGDIVTAIGNQQLNQNTSIRKAAAGQLTVIRDGKPVSIRVQQN